MSGKRARRNRAQGLQCSDCGKRVVKGQLVHEPTCPAALAVDELMISDAEWFKQRPGIDHRCRWITAAERMEMGDAAGRSLSPDSVIYVKQLEPGVRARALYIPGNELVQAGVVGVFGHSATFEYLAKKGLPLPETSTGRLEGTDLEVRLFRLPSGFAEENLKSAEVEGVVIVSPGGALPVPFR